MLNIFWIWYTCGFPCFVARLIICGLLGFCAVIIETHPPSIFRHASDSGFIDFDWRFLRIVPGRERLHMLDLSGPLVDLL